MTLSAHKRAAWPALAPAAGVVLQFAVLAALAAGTSLGAAGWLAGTVYAVACAGLLHRARRRDGRRPWGPADTVTLARATLIGGVTALAVDSLAADSVTAPAVVLAGLAATALLLDGVDGHIARRTGTASRLGARFDVETDAFLVLVLSAYVASSLGWWVLAAGVPHYAFAAAGWAWPWLRGSLPARRFRKVVAGTQGVVLVVASAGVAPAPLATAGIALMLALLAWSFGRDIRWLWQTREPEQDEAAAGTARRRLVVARAVTVAAALLVLAALVAPNQPAHFAPAAFLRIPAEGLVAVAVLLLLPARARPVAAALAGLLIGLLAIAKLFDIGFFSVLARPFDPVLDWGLLEPAVGFLTEAVGRAGAIAAVVGAVLLAVVLLVLLALAAVRVTRTVARRRAAAGGVAASLAVVWVVCALLGVQIVPGVPVAAHEYDRVLQVGRSLQDRQEFAQEAAVDAFRDTPGEDLLTALRGKDVIVAFVESYGRYPLEDPELAPPLGAALADGERRLAAGGFESASAFLTAPTVGGVSWLGHATLLSGLWVDNQQRYRTLVSSDRFTLNRAFQRAGWQTVAVMPAIWEAWPEGEFFGYDRIYDADALGYDGPRTNWGIIPDQYTLATFQRLERAREDRRPVMATMPLISSHAPWTPVPALIDWSDAADAEATDGASFAPLAGSDRPVDEVWNDPERVREHYRMAIEYSLQTLISYVETYGDDDLVLVLLGDHQAPRLIIGQDASHDVPVTLISGDPAVQERISGWGWQDGLRPGPQAPVWPMDAFRDRFLTAFGPAAPGDRHSGDDEDPYGLGTLMAAPTTIAVPKPAGRS